MLTLYSSYQTILKYIKDMHNSYGFAMNLRLNFGKCSLNFTDITIKKIFFKGLIIILLN